MPQTINVPGAGLVQFPDSMSDDEIVAAIKKITSEQGQQKPVDQMSEQEQINLINQQSRQRPDSVSVTSGRPAVGSGQFPSITAPEKAISDTSKGAGVFTSFMAGIPTEQQSAIKYFAKSRGIPENRYAVIGGDIAYMGNDGKWYKEVSGVLPTMAFNAPDVAEMVPDIGVGIATAPLITRGPLGAAAAAGTTAATAAATNYARQKLAGLIADQQVNPFEVGLSGGLSLLGEAVPVARKAIMERRLARDIAQINPAEVAALRAKAGKIGVPLTAAELTNLSSLMSTQKVLGNIPESSVKMQKFYAEREAKVQSAVDDYLSSLSKVEEASVAGNRGLQALEIQRDNLIRARDEAVEPIYRSAFESSVPVNTQPVLDQVDNMLRTQPPTGKAASYLRRIRDMLQRPGIDEAGNTLETFVPEDRLPVLQNVKFELDAMFNDDAFTSLDRGIQARLTGIKNNLVNQMGIDNPDYIAANRRFEVLSQPINEFNERITGVSLSRMSADNMKNFSRRIFENASPDTVRYAKEQITSGGGEEAWNAVTRAYLQDQWNVAKKAAKGQQGEKLDTGNTWQNILLGDAKQQKALRVALDQDKFNALRDLAEVLQAAGRVKKLGSDTAFNQLITEELIKNPPYTGVVTGAARVVGSALQPQNYGKMIADWATKRDASKNAEQLADMISDPNAVEQLKQLRKMSPTSAKYWAGLGQLLANYGIMERRD